MAYVDRTLTQAENALHFILDHAPACIATMQEGSRQAVEAQGLFDTAHRGPVTELSTDARVALAGYAATMHRNPPSTRTIRGLLRLIQK
jgi:hypothetical protein